MKFAAPTAEHAEYIADTGKRERVRLAKSELWVLAAGWAAAHAHDVLGEPRYPGDSAPRPITEWGADDPFVDLCARYGLTPDDLARILNRVADECETHATRCGYEEAWR